MNKLNVAIIGQGRSGRDIHGRHFKSENNTQFNVVAVVERDETRRNRALEEYEGCEVFADFKELYGRKDIDLVVNASFSNEHFSVTKDLLENGFNVVVEKPFARNRFECDTLIKLAKDNNVTLAVFQQSLFAPFFLKAKEVIASGKLGRITQININYNNFARRWDWQTSQAKMGGNIYNTGPHPIGYGLSLLDFDPETRVAFSKLDNVLSSGDADDFAKIILSAPNKPVVDIEISSNDAFAPSSKIKILGSRGTCSVEFNKYNMKYFVDGENPEQKLILESLKTDEGLPAYCKETLVTHEENEEFTGSAFDMGTKCFYEMMYSTLTTGAPLTIKPEYAAMIISVIEQVHAENPLPVKF